MTGVDTTDTWFEQPCGRNVDGIELGVDALQLLPFLSPPPPKQGKTRRGGKDPVGAM